jgi:hypothetical protein
MPTSLDHLAHHSAETTTALAGKVVARIVRHRQSEVLIEFTDGSRLFADAPSAALELSITSPNESEGA